MVIHSIIPERAVKSSLAGSVSIFLIMMMFGQVLYAQPRTNAEREFKEIGSGFPHRDAQNRAEKCATATRAATIEARARLLEAIVVEITSEATTQNERVEKSAVTSYAKGKLVGSEVLDKKEIDNCDSVEVTVGTRVDLKEAIKEISASN